MIRNPETAHVVHYAFEWLALGTGLFLFRLRRKKTNQSALLAQGMFAVLVCGLIGAGLGNKLSFMFQYPSVLTDRPVNWSV